MKILQNHFTTPKQSKRLLALGVPANSADMYYHLANHQYYVRDEFSIKQHDFFEFYKNIFYPCWSVGRLIEIMQICSIPVTTWYIKSNSGMQPDAGSEPYTQVFTPQRYNFFSNMQIINR